jgi:hypothetical protein
MCIDLVDVYEKMDSPEIAAYRNNVIAAIDKFHSLIGHNNYDEQVDEYFCSISPHLGNEAAAMIDSFRHAFSHYTYGGLHWLFTHQENECWYPKVVINKVIEPNDINTLDELLFIFRGASESELESASFGQSWTTRLEVAKDFAYKHYLAQDWYKEEERLIFCAIYERCNVLFSDQSQLGEYEIAVNPARLVDVERYE